MKKKLSEKEIEKLFSTLKSRFEKNMHRHQNIKWSDVQKKLEKSSDKISSLFQMEETGGEPDIVEFGNKKGEIFFVDCSVESPSGRRSLCYDRKGLESRKEAQPKNTAIDLANEMGIELLDEEKYRFLQEIENFDLKTSSWIKTPEKIRKLGGAIFCDRRYDFVFLYHNGAQSYYAGRGFRGLLKI